MPAKATTAGAAPAVQGAEAHHSDPRSLRRLVSGLCGLVLAGSGAVIGVQEWRGYSDLQGEMTIYRLLESELPLHLGFGTRSVAATLEACFAGFDEIGAFYDSESITLSSSACRATAEAALAQSPTDGAARLLLAESLFRLGLSSQAVAQYRLAELAAPHTMWLQERRLRLLAKFDPALWSELAAPALLADLLAVPASRDWLARLFVEDAQVRAVVEASATRVPAQQAKSFVAAVARYRAAQANGGIGDE